ncbi:HTH-type transcriptional repressor KstR2 [Nocardioides dokdonensis FR1436]|uniref:HTH-type transcriptional repressor KstR2 n=1 Tax=Nocardioides dokdonensis FR1436 TaxID=1300347 RepID=A0A1A9GLL0_9ACTN|nr:TetR/AcrR family transcriptional regulator [Nocardioides dokdonensis]ANH38986.1 HTH-type transcriptional repressor KstR2 [Nocardioides dokdonensis FR1436]
MIVASAVHNFTERGYHGTSMRDIARGADVTVASIYHHFPAKQDILRDIMVSTMRDILEQTRASVAAVETTAATRLGALMRTWVLFHTTRRSEALIGASELRSLDDRGRRLVIGLRDEQEAVFRILVEEGVTTGEFGTAHPLEAARAVINMGYSIAAWYRPDGEASPEEMAERYCDLALATVSASPAH